MEAAEQSSQENRDSTEESSKRYSLNAAMAATWAPTTKFLSESVLAEIRNRAAAADESGILSQSTVDLLRNVGYFGLPVPRDLQGGGANLFECAAVQRRLGMADPALAIAVNMHLFSLGMAVRHWEQRRDSCGLLLEMVASQNRIIASAFAEPGLGGALLRSTAIAKRTVGGYLVSGVKSPCSLAAHCDLVCFQMQAPLEAEGVMLCVIPAHASGIRVERTWDSLGMRASGSDTLVLEQCFVPDELIYHRCQPGFCGDEIFAAGLLWFCITTTATYLGVARAAVDAACDALHRSKLAHLGASRATLPSVQGQLGDLIAALLPLEVACTSVAKRLDSGQHDPRSLLPLAVAIKHAAVDGCTRAIGDSVELIGPGAYGRTGLLARLWRDVQAARFHPPTRLVARQLLGKWALGLPFSFELDEYPND